MADRIEPALSAEEWAQEARARATFGQSMDESVSDDPAIAAYLVALNNAALPDGDPRKITRMRLVDLRSAAHHIDRIGGHGERIRAIADALESYLPPETP